MYVTLDTFILNNCAGSHLVDRLMIAGHHVIVVDNMFTGRQKNVAQWIGHPHFQLIIHDVVGTN
jgi:UDP-glucuronate decarboxylase